MPLIHAPELASAIRRRYGIRGAQGFEAISPELVPVTIVDDIQLQSKRQCGGSSRSAPVVAEFSFVVLIGLAPLTRIHGVWVTAAANYEAQVVLTTTSSTVATPGAKHFKDRRMRGDPAAVMGAQSNAAFPGGDSIVRIQGLAGTSIWIPLGVVLAPQADLPENAADRIVVGNTAGTNADIVVSWDWEEGPPEPGLNVP